MITPNRDALLDSNVLANLARRAEDADRRDDWPAASWQLVRQAGVLAWSVPAAYGGLGLSAVELLAGYEQLASACLTTAFILSQREAAVRRLDAYPVADLQQRFLPALVRGELLATVGLSQLTTSRQHQVAGPPGHAGQLPGSARSLPARWGHSLGDRRGPRRSCHRGRGASRWPAGLARLAGEASGHVGGCAAALASPGRLPHGPDPLRRRAYPCRPCAGRAGRETPRPGQGRRGRAGNLVFGPRPGARPWHSCKRKQTNGRRCARRPSVSPRSRHRLRAQMHQLATSTQDESQVMELRVHASELACGPPRQRWPWPRAPASSPRTRCSAGPGRPCSSWSGPVRAPSPRGSSPGSCPTERVVWGKEGGRGSCRAGVRRLGRSLALLLVLNPRSPPACGC